ncbi:Uncharacterised protein [Mycobacterium tuberculosis]|uniref:Uncharacterized protein n=1 Tax=Mycobacterium tuberculosis TaxID=1773 RepID=A0A655FDR3_MYCTX|nr:Uncharacterised protein [Mycobacterium tuberculosis]CKT12865.1 Uncharacterised protein [Mycobacterium tuberculosis]CNV12114.1 Uncharacterised protein [Mycobacterium tuberculosis]CNV64058.1 Uncharacterised protein [Mycobacterium tuberculosis]CNV66015.1 Uncharacterised protein [Mycobacterium tuberculosis]
MSGGQPAHDGDEILAGPAGVDPGGPYHGSLRERCQHSLLAGEFAAGIHALRRGFIGGLVGPGLGAAEVAIEYVVGGDVD